MAAVSGSGMVEPLGKKVASGPLDTGLRGSKLVSKRNILTFDDGEDWKRKKR